MKLAKPLAMASFRFLILIIVPIYIVKYLNDYLSYLGVSIAEYGLFVFLAGIFYIVFKFLEESMENPRYKLVFALVALASVLMWIYYLLNKGNFAMDINGVILQIDYQKLLLILLLLLALRIPEVIMRYYLELQRYDRMKREQSSAGESL